jgi:hypothetical protein
MKFNFNPKKIACFAMIAIYLPAFFIISFIFIPPPVSAAMPGNTLANIAEDCGGIKREGEDGNAPNAPRTQWDRCENAQDEMHRELGCSENMFYQKTDPSDSTVKLNEWYVKAAEYAGCYQKANAKLTKITNECTRMVHGDGVDDSAKWEECEKEQDRMEAALGCSGNLFKKIDARYFGLDTAKIDECKGRVTEAGNMKVEKTDGTREEAASVLPAATGPDAGDEAETQANCDTTGVMLSWIICPIIDLGAGLSDFVFEDIVQPLLETVPVSSNPDGGTYKAWSSFRLLANILLVGSLLAIVYSQAKGGK